MMALVAISSGFGTAFEDVIAVVRTISIKRFPALTDRMYYV
jgi:hypothetical protein